MTKAQELLAAKAPRVRLARRRVVLGLSYYIRGRIGPARWRTLHRFTALAWVLGVVHALMLGTDAGTVWFLLAATLVVVPAAALLARRLMPELAT